MPRFHDHSIQRSKTIFFPFVLERPVRRTSEPNGPDILKAKTVLADLGSFEPEVGEITPFTENALFDGIAGFQEANSLPVSGDLTPGDETVLTLRDQFARRHGLRRNGPQHIEKSVGKGGLNLDTDLGRISGLLDAAGQKGEGALQPGFALNQRISDFQDAVGLKPDGKIEPGGETLEILGDVAERAGQRPRLQSTVKPMMSISIKPNMVITDLDAAYKALGYDPDETP
jgi:hypothetical protein